MGYNTPGIITSWRCNTIVKGSIIWLNYNSASFINVALKSLDSVLQIDYDDYELIVVDNGSTDGSFERIREYVEKHKKSGIKIKFVRSCRNLGYAGGMNLGWEARSRDSKYVVFLNNDLIVEYDSLRKIIDFMEGDEKLAASNGLIFLGNEKRIFSAGGFGTELWEFGNICWSLTVDECIGVDKPHYVTYANGAYMVVKANIIEKVCPRGKPFIDETFLYLDDHLLGLILWNKGYKIMYIPIRAGFHFEGLTTGRSLLKMYIISRNTTATTEIVNMRFSRIRHLYTLMHILSYSFSAISKPYDNTKKYYYMIKGVVSGLRLSRLLSNIIGYLDITKAPYVPLSLKDLYYKVITKFNSTFTVPITFDKLRYPP